MIWRRFQGAGATVRVGLLVDSRGIPEWLASLLESPQMPPSVQVTDIFVIPSGEPGESSPPELFRRLAAFSQRASPDRFAPVAIPSRFQRHDLSPFSRGALTDEDRKAITAKAFDFLVCATAEALAGDCRDLARCGVWSVAFGEPELMNHRPPYWREVYENRAVSRLFLLSHPERFENPEIQEQYVAATDPSLFFTRNHTAPLLAAQEILCRRLAGPAGSPPAGDSLELPRASAPRWPSIAETASFVVRKLMRSARLGLSMRGRTLEWFVALRTKPGLVDGGNLAAGEPFLVAEAPAGHYYADPFLVEHDSRHWLFVEDYVVAEERACLACMEIRDGRIAGEPTVILKQPYHLSYPHVFLHKGDYFMIPESSEAGNVQLYRARRFPFEWECEAILLDNAGLVNTTPFHYDGKWYFFTSTLGPLEEAYLFSSHHLDGAWEYHPANPICSDVRGVRGAGAIFSQAGEIFRPVQDCSQGYGYAVVLNQIERLSEREFKERSIGTLLPVWRHGLLRTHTLNSDSLYQAVDGLRAVPRRP